jgi:hypothetical protein
MGVFLVYNYDFLLKTVKMDPPPLGPAEAAAAVRAVAAAAVRVVRSAMHAGPVSYVVIVRRLDPAFGSVDRVRAARRHARRAACAARGAMRRLAEPPRCTRAPRDRQSPLARDSISQHGPAAPCI